MPGSLYYIALVPGEPVSGRIRKLQQEVAGTFHSRHALKSPPHITLQMPFRMETGRQRALEKLLQRICPDRPFTVTLNGFGHFGNRVLFIAVRDSQALQGLHRDVHEGLGTGGFVPASGDQRPFHPHVTLASRDLQPGAFNRAWAHFGTAGFLEQFEADAISLLRQRDGKWHIESRLQFGE